MRTHPQPAAGSRSAWHLLTHPRAIWTAPSQPQREADLGAVLAGGSRTVACFLSADFGPYPRRLRQGVLRVELPTAAWRPFWSLRRQDLALPADLVVAGVRDASASDRGPKDWLFQVVVARCPEGTLTMAVPTADVAMVTRYLSAT
ncbi:hypothetical protein [Cellulomonas soli]|uniref:Uncharacterized protein n=1 Tax=Cellulomonas soli TaxID=931535 RepID=A0A512PEK1_9CELL|nr:hypothetical protein [Cellulomonas soli]NYI58935.1 hypothetical protein [Cellulomonas soli]GEP69572.1 hypothetical protein CSO01_22870 [Cellulomonas soli]